MKIIKLVLVFVVVGVLFISTMATAKMGIILLQKTCFINSLDGEGVLRTKNNVIYEFNNEDIKNKAASFVGKQVNILYYGMGSKKVCVDIAPMTARPFKITTPMAEEKNKYL